MKKTKRIGNIVRSIILIFICFFLTNFVKEKTASAQAALTFDITQAANAMIQIEQQANELLNQVQMIEHLANQTQQMAKQMQGVADLGEGASVLLANFKKVSTVSDVLEVAFGAKDGITKTIKDTMGLVGNYNDTAKYFKDVYGPEKDGEATTDEKLRSWNEKTKDALANAYAASSAAISVADERKKTVTQLVNQTENITNDLQGLQVLIKMMGVLSDQMRDLTVLVSTDVKQKAVAAAEKKAVYRKATTGGIRVSTEESDKAMQRTVEYTKKLIAEKEKIRQGYLKGWKK